MKIVDEDKHYPDIKLSSSGQKSYAISIIDFGETISSKRKCKSLRKKVKYWPRLAVINGKNILYLEIWEQILIQHFTIYQYGQNVKK